MANPATFLAASLFAVLGGLAALDLEWTAWALLNLPAILLVGRTFYECASAMAALRQVIAVRRETPEASYSTPVGSESAVRESSGAEVSWQPGLKPTPPSAN